MKSRAEILNLIVELRGRLDEIETLVRLDPPAPVPLPATPDGDAAEIVTPDNYLAFRNQPPGPAETRERLQTFRAFVQFGAEDAATVVEFRPFDLGAVHRSGLGAATGLRMVPDRAAPQKWFTYEFLAPQVDLADWDWLEWTLKLSLDAPGGTFAQIVIEPEGGGPLQRLTLGNRALSEFAGFHHFRMTRADWQALAPRSGRLRLCLGMSGGRPVPLTLYGLILAGGRHDPAGARNA
ncbi:hypothetical protein GC209_19700 [bacterium]|nr:hypothetical protein [bacterium]